MGNKNDVIQSTCRTASRRRRTKKDRLVQMRTDEELLRQINSQRLEWGTNQSEAVRRLIEKGLSSPVITITRVGAGGIREEIHPTIQELMNYADRR
jgi:hypothetical protein